MPRSPAFLPSIVANFQTNRAKRGKNEFLFGVLWCFLGKIGDKKGQNLNIFLKVRKENGWRGGRLPAFWRVHLGRWSGNSCYFADVSKNGQNPLLLVAFLLCLWCVACKYGSISRFKGVFRGFPLLDVCLYCLCALRGLWGFCVREVFGGFMA